MKLMFKITDFLHKKSGIKVLAVILIIGIFFFHHAYAADEGGLLSNTRDRLDKGVGFLSWIWIFLAIIAGKFMTNDVVYGAFMNLDKYLRAIRNVMKNFANFGLAAMILYSIITYVVDKKGGGDDPKKIVVKTLIAGVLIQMSRFAVGALVDISTVATSAIAAFPAKFIGDTQLVTNVGKEIKKISKLQYYAKIEDGKFKREQPEPMENSQSCNVDSLDAMMPKYDSVSGPLIFIGMSFFKVQNFMNTQGVITDTANGAGQLIINLALKFLILLAYVGCLIGLVIANLVRVLFLRLLIMVSPIAVLMGVFGKKMEGQGFMKYFNIQTFLDLIFKPLFFIGFIGLTLIFVSSMQQIMGNNKGLQDQDLGVKISSTTSDTTIGMSDIADFTINGNVFSDIADDTKTVFVDLMLIFMTLLLLRQMLKRSVQFGEGPIQDVMSKITPLVESLAGTLPVIPTPGGENIGLSGLLEASKRGTQRTLEAAGIKGRIGDSEFGRFYNNEEEFQKRVNQQFLGIAAPRSDADEKQLSKLITSEADKTGEGNFFATLQQKGREGREGGLSLGNPKIKKMVVNRFERYKTSYPEVIYGAGFSRGMPYTDFESFFGGKGNDTQQTKENRAKLHELLGGDANVETKTAGVPDFNTLMSNRYFMKESAQ